MAAGDTRLPGETREDYRLRMALDFENSGTDREFYVSESARVAQDIGRNRGRARLKVVKPAKRKR